MRPDVGPGLARIVARCLEKDRTRRYQDANALLEDLERLELALRRPVPPQDGRLQL